MSQLHIAIQEGAQLPPVQKCSECCDMYHCPLCSPHVYKPTHRYKVHRHLRCHRARAIQFKGHSVYKCNLGCRPQAHFHCFCEKLFLNRNQFLHHLNTKHRLLADSGHSPLDTETCSNRSPVCDEAAPTASSWSSAMPEAASSHPSQQSDPGTEDASSRAADHIHLKAKFPAAPGGADSHLSPTPVELEILTRLGVVQQQQSHILQLLQQLTHIHSRSGPAPASLGAMFPIADEEGLAALEEKLSQNPDLKNKLISFFGDADGFPIDQTVHVILQRMLSSNFSKRMDWRGKTNKTAFASSCLREIVRDAVRRNSVCARAADEAVECAVKKWLQQASETPGQQAEEGMRG
ncbi:uncharacterized protein PAE49_012767 [Odontesthes bonariensis]|uniref:uncharacterized protein LOC142391391 n=1 Tax=Odontesthes bonariensis TaxID=219752 RepID=UPI003F5835E7